MKITKYKKTADNRYKVTIDEIDYTLYDDVIINNKLLLKEEISPTELNNILKENDELICYYASIKYITKKLRSEKEIRDYLNKKEVSLEIINKTINRLYDNNFLNEDLYIKAYINDQINLTNNGPLKIKKNLIKLGIDETKINDFFNNIAKEEWVSKIEKYINKKIKMNHTSSEYMLKNKIKNDLINLGYEKSMIDYLLVNIRTDEKQIYNKEYEKIKNKLEKKYTGKELDYQIKVRLYRKGFKVSSNEE